MPVVKSEKVAKPTPQNLSKIQRKEEAKDASGSEHTQADNKLSASQTVQRLATDSKATLRPNEIVALQQTLGNKAVQRLYSQRNKNAGAVRRQATPKAGGANTVQRLLMVNDAKIKSTSTAWNKITNATYQPANGQWTTAHKDKLKTWIDRKDVYGAAKWYMTAQSWSFSNWEEAAEALDAHVRTQSKRNKERKLAKKASKDDIIRQDLATALGKVGNWIDTNYTGKIKAESYSGEERSYKNIWDYLEKFKGQYRNWYPNGSVKSRMLTPSSNRVSTNFVLLREIFYALSSITEVGEDEDAVPSIRPSGARYGTGMHGNVRVDKGTGMETRRDDFTPEANHQWVQKARQLNMPLGAGASNTTDGILHWASKAGISKDEKEAIAWSAFIFWNKRYYKIQGYGHTFHEVMDLAKQHGVSYTPGNYKDLPGEELLLNDKDGD